MIDVQEITKTIESKLTESTPLIHWQVRYNDYHGLTFNIEIIGTIYVNHALPLNHMLIRSIEECDPDNEQWIKHVSHQVAHGLADLLLKTKR